MKEVLLRVFRFEYFVGPFNLIPEQLILSLLIQGILLFFHEMLPKVKKVLVKFLNKLRILMYFGLVNLQLLIYILNLLVFGLGNLRGTSM